MAVCSRGVLSKSPIRLVLFDAFDTLVTPTKAPYVQYAEVARSPDFNLQVKEEDVKVAFKAAFKSVSLEYPNYGLDCRDGTINSPDEWWFRVIRQTFSPHLHRGITTKEFEETVPLLSKQLVRRFGTQEAYTLFEDVLPTLSDLRSKGCPIALATNSDSRILSVLKSFKLDSFLELDHNNSSPQTKAGGRPTLSYFERVAKPNADFFHAALKNNKSSITTEPPLNPDQVLYVGDQLHEDFWGATDAGLQALWIQRPRPNGVESNQPFETISKPRNTQTEIDFVKQRTITNLHDVVDFVLDSWERRA